MRGWSPPTPASFCARAHRAGGNKKEGKSLCFSLRMCTEASSSLPQTQNLAGCSNPTVSLSPIGREAGAPSCDHAGERARAGCGRARQGESARRALSEALPSTRDSLCSNRIDSSSARASGDLSPPPPTHTPPSLPQQASKQARSR